MLETIENKIIDCLYNIMFKLTGNICKRRSTFLNLYFEYSGSYKLKRYDSNRKHSMNIPVSCYSVRFYFSYTYCSSDIVISWYNEYRWK